ncbi:lasso peptide biosynthesis protein [Streptomyces sp. NPDC050315]|uniref:lasso peptide biosynthesis protein n=1 Tax=Streptomyces sp. NPDC050315 TaxID=3155039 RepID=UPI00342448CB
MGSVRADWEFLLWDTDQAPPPSLPPRLRLVAVARTLHAVRLLRRHGWPDAQRCLRGMLPASRLGAELEPPAALRLAHRETLPCFTALRLVEPNALCLPRSFALATYLSALGLPAEVVVARQRTTIGARFAFHAWTELYGEVLADIPTVQLGFTVLQRVGCEQAMRTSTPVGAGTGPG